MGSENSMMDSIWKYTEATIRINTQIPVVADVLMDLPSVWDVLTFTRVSTGILESCFLFSRILS